VEWKIGRGNPPPQPTNRIQYNSSNICDTQYSVEVRKIGYAGVAIIQSVAAADVRRKVYFSTRCDTWCRTYCEKRGKSSASDSGTTTVSVTPAANTIRRLSCL